MQRQEYIDMACGIVILKVVINHIFGIFRDEDILYLWHFISQFLSFSTPFFFFKSGMFFSYKLDARKKFVSICKRILLPFAFFSIITEPIYWIDLYTAGVPVTDLHSYAASCRTILHLGNMAGNAPCWFLLSLFLILSTFNIIRDKWNTWVLLFFIGILFLTYHYFDPFPIHLCSLSHTLTGFFFFLCGILLKKHIYSSNILWSAIIILFVIICSGEFAHVDIFYDKVRTGKYWIWPIQTVALIVVFCNICKLVFSSTSILCQKLAFIGKHTMPLFVTHWPFIIIFKIVGNNLCQLDSLVLTFISLVTYFILIPHIIQFFDKSNLRCLIGK